MLTLINNTKSTSIVGKLVSIDTVNPNAFIYTVPNSMRAIGVVIESVPYRSKCKIATIGDKANVLVQGNAVKDDIIRCSKSGDNASLGTCKVAKSTDEPYLKVGVALSPGNNLIPVVLDLIYLGNASGVAYVPYTGATDDVDLGTHSLTSGGGRFGSATDYVDIDENGEMTFNGDATVWDDMRIVPGSFDRPGVSDPAYVAYAPNGGGLTIYIPEFAKNDFASFTIQIPHSYQEGGSIYVHIHWTPGANGVAENGNTVGWKIDYTWANISGNFPDMQTIDLSDACDGTNHKHQMTPEVAIIGTGKTISSMLLCNIRRTDTGTDDTWAGTVSGSLPMLLEVDFHYPINSVGSKTDSAK